VRVSDFPSSSAGVSVRVEWGSALLGNCCSTLWDRLVASSSGIKISTEDGGKHLPRNVGRQSPNDAVPCLWKKADLKFCVVGFEQVKQTNKQTKTENQLWRGVITGRLLVSQLLQKFPAFYEIWIFITAFTRARHLSICWARAVQAALILFVEDPFYYSAIAAYVFKVVSFHHNAGKSFSNV